MHATMGVQVAILTLDRNDPEWVTDVPASVIECGPSRGNYGYNRRIEAKLTEVAGSFGTMVVHGLWQFHGLCASRVSSKIGVPYFVFPHGMLDPWFKKSYPVKHLKKQLYWMLAERQVLEGARAVVFTSENESRLAKATFRPEANYQPRIVPLEYPKRPRSRTIARDISTKLPAFTRSPVYPFSREAASKKGCDLLVKAMAQIQPPIDLVLAGPNAIQEYADHLRKSAQGLPVFFTGMIQADVKMGALSSAEALILPSHQENFGLVVAEALAFGTPVLVSERVNIVEHVRSFGAGFVEPDTLVGTRRLIERWLQEGNHGMRTAALKCFQERFDIEKSARELLEIFFGDG